MGDFPKRIVRFKKPGIEFGQSMLDGVGTVILTGEQHEDFPDPIPMDCIQMTVLDHEGKPLCAFCEYRVVSFFLNGADWSKINAASDGDRVELEWGSRG